MKLLGSTKKDVDQDKDGEDVPKLESGEVVLVHHNLVNNNYQQASKVLFTFDAWTEKKKNWTANKYCTTLINNAKHNKYRIFIC